MSRYLQVINDDNIEVISDDSGVLSLAKVFSNPDMNSSDRPDLYRVIHIDGDRWEICLPVSVGVNDDGPVFPYTGYPFPYFPILKLPQGVRVGGIYIDTYPESSVMHFEVRVKGDGRTLLKQAKVYMFEYPIKTKGFGLEIYDKYGHVIFDSFSKPMKIIDFFTTNERNIGSYIYNKEIGIAIMPLTHYLGTYRSNTGKIEPKKPIPKTGVYIYYDNYALEITGANSFNINRENHNWNYKPTYTPLGEARRVSIMVVDISNL